MVLSMVLRPMAAIYMDAGKKGAYPASVLENKRMIIFFQEQMRNAMMIQTPEQRVSNLTQPWRILHCHFSKYPIIKK